MTFGGYVGMEVQGVVPTVFHMCAAYAHNEHVVVVLDLVP